MEISVYLCSLLRTLIAYYVHLLWHFLQVYVCYLFSVKHQIGTLYIICHLGIFFSSIPIVWISELKVELMVFSFLIGTLDHFSFTSLKPPQFHQILSPSISPCANVFPYHWVVWKACLTLLFYLFGILDKSSCW